MTTTKYAAFPRPNYQLAVAAEMAQAEAAEDAGRCQRTHYVTAEGGRFRARCAMERRHRGRCVDGKGMVW